MPTSAWRVMVLGALWLVACTTTAGPPSPLNAPKPTVVLPADVTALPKATAPSAGATVAGTGVGPEVGEDRLDLTVATYEPFLRWQTDASSGIPYAALDRAQYDAARSGTTRRSFKLVYLENEYLKISFLPELGGRLYQVLFKPTHQSLFYNNPSIQPSHFGPLDDAHNWWLAAGGMEWAVPVQEHGYEWGVPWEYSTQTTSDAASITLRDSDAPDRLQTGVTVTLRRGEAAWTISPSLANRTTRPVRVQFWLNAMLTLGAASMSRGTQFLLPTASVRVHSTGDERLPGPKQVISWPQFQGVDFSQYRSWEQWLGVFAEDTQAGWDGAYNQDTGLGIVRVFPPAAAPGVKLFAFGPQYADRSYTSDGSQYFELWGGPNRSFWTEDDVPLAAGAALGWTETWYPVNGTGGLRFANARAALNIAADSREVVLGVSTPAVQHGRLVATSGGRTIVDTSAEVVPGLGFVVRWTAPASEPSPSHIVLQWLDDQAALVAQTEAEINLH